MTHQLNWEDLKKELEKVKGKTEGIHDLDYCPACNTNFGQLIKDLDWLFKQGERDAEELIKIMGGKRL